MRETIDQKAARLVIEGRITQVPSITYVAVGDTDVYLVTYLTAADSLGEKAWHCDCPTEGICSHIRGAQTIHG